MTEQLDSRVLRHTDTYAKRFVKPGEYRYGIGPAGGSWSGEAPYVIEVSDGGAAQATQTTVTIAFDEGRFTPSDEKIQIAAGDVVMWHSPDAETHPYAVHGEIDDFSSDRLIGEAIYTHAFLTPGEHSWIDAYGKKVGGTIRVSVPDATAKRDYGAWQRQMLDAVLVTIIDGRAEPAEVDIVVGQTVYFATTNGSGISVTAKEMLAGGKGFVDRRVSGSSFFRMPA